MCLITIITSSISSTVYNPSAMSKDIIVTTGALVGVSPNRLESRTLIKNEKQFSLYIQALCTFHSQSIA